MREQDPNTYQDWPQLQNALKVSARRVLHAQGAWWSGHVVHGSCAHSSGELLLHRMLQKTTKLTDYKHWFFILLLDK